MTVDSFNGRTGIVSPASGDYPASIINYTLPGSGTTRTVEARLGNYVSVADYGATTAATDNATAINAALAAGGQVYLPPGDYACKSTININAAICRGFFGPGRLVMASTFTGPDLVVVSEAGPCTIKEIGLIVNKTTFPEKAAIDISGATDVTLTDIQISQTGIRGIGIFNSNRIHINGRTSVAKFAERGIQVANSSEVLLDGVTVLNTDAVAGNCIAVGNSTNIKIVSAFVDAKGAASFAIHFTPTCLNSGIANSIVLNSQLEAIAGTNCRDLFVTGNTLKWPDNPGHDSANSYGDCPNLIVANNQIVGPGGMGMIVDAGCYNFVIDNNIIQNAGTFSPNSPVGTLHANGIEIWPSSNAVIDAYVGGSVTNNIIANAEGANKCQYGVRELSVAEIGYGTGNPNRTTIVNNTCINMAGGAIHTVGTDSYIGLNTQRVGNLTTMIGSNNDIVLPTPGKGLSFTGSGSNIKWGAREIINVAPGASLGTGIGSGLIMFHDISVGGGALVFFDAGSAGYKIIAELGTSIFVTSDPGPGSDKWWIQHAGVITNRFSVSHALDYALVSSRGGTLV